MVFTFLNLSFIFLIAFRFLKFNFKPTAFTSHLGQTLLFSAWEIKDEKRLAIACVAVAVVAVINEGLKAARQKLTHKTKPGQFLNKTYAQKLFNRWHIINTLLSLLQVLLRTPT
jgi:hypothetical protein